MAPVTIAIVLVVAVQRYIQTFTAEGIRTWLPLPDAEVTAHTNAGTITGSSDGLTVVATDVNTISAVSLGASIAVVALSWIAVAICMTVLTRQLIAGQAFSRRANRAVNAASYITVGGTLLAMTLDKFAQNGVATALGLANFDSSTGFVWLEPYVMPWAFAFFVGVLGLAFARGAQLQKDTQGLV